MERFNVYVLVTISTLLMIADDFLLKYMMKSMKNYSIIFINAIIVGTILCFIALYFGGTDQLIEDIGKLRGSTLLIFLVFSFNVAIFKIIEYNLLRSEKLSDLILISTSIGIISTIIISALFLEDKISKSKLLAIPFLLTGAYLAH